MPLEKRLSVVVGIFALIGALLGARLFQVQILQHDSWALTAEKLHWGGIVLPAARGEILARDRLSGEEIPLATSAQLELLYLDPKFILSTRQVAGREERVGDPETIARELAPLLLPVFLEREKERRETTSPAEIGELPGRRFFKKEGQRTIELTGFGGRPMKEARDECLSFCWEKNLREAEGKRNLPGVAEGAGEEEAVESEPLTREEREEIWQRCEEHCDRELAGVELAPEEEKEEGEAVLPFLKGVSEEELAAALAKKDSGDGAGLPLPSREGSGEGSNREESSHKPAATSQLLLQTRDFLREAIFQNPDSRYLPIVRRLPPEVSIAIDALEAAGKNLKGVVRLPEPWRVFPEGETAGALLGFVDHERIGRYGLEEALAAELRGRDGRILTERDTAGREIAIGEKIVEPARDGTSFVLSIDRAVQTKVEKILARKVAEFDADAAQAIVMEPATGRIVAMAQAPGFDPNKYWEALATRPLSEAELAKISAEWEEMHRGAWPVLGKPANSQQPTANSQLIGPPAPTRHCEDDDCKEEDAAIHSTDEETTISSSPTETAAVAPLPRSDVNGSPAEPFKIYRNGLGPAVFRNRLVDEVFEPGSIFKALVMAAGLDAHSVTPDTRCDICDGPIPLDEYEVHTWDDKYLPNQTMIETLRNSDNTGMTFVAQKMGKKLLWRYLRDFGFGERADSPFPFEKKGSVPLWRYLADIDHATLAFGQGVSVTGLQMITAFAAAVNGGWLLEPILLEEKLFPDGRRERSEPRVRRRVISEEASAMISSMLVSVVEEGGGKLAKVPGYLVGGKTGTAQIAGFYRDFEGVKRYGYEAGVGSTVASFIGFAPLQEPRFVMLVKFDRPRTSEWGSIVAASAWQEIAEFLLKDFYQVPAREEGEAS